MSQTLTPPPVSPAPLAPRPPRSRTVATTVTVIGCVTAGAIVIGGIAFALLRGGSASLSEQATTAGVTAVKIDADAAEVDVTFSDSVTRAELTVAARGGQGVGDWTLERDGDTLRLVDESGWFDGSWFGGDALGITVGDHVSLVLPASLEGAVDMDADLGSGSLAITGDVREADLDVAAGALHFTGAATRLDVDVSAGSATVRTTDARSIDVEVSAGRAVLEATGTAPESTAIDVSAGSATVTLPDVPYAVSGHASAGSRTIDVRQDSAARHTLDVSVSAGSATVSPED